MHASECRRNVLPSSLLHLQRSPFLQVLARCMREGIGPWESVRPPVSHPNSPPHGLEIHHFSRSGTNCKNLFFRLGSHPVYQMMGFCVLLLTNESAYVLHRLCLYYALPKKNAHAAGLSFLAIGDCGICLRRWRAKLCGKEPEPGEENGESIRTSGAQNRRWWWWSSWWSC